MSHALDFLVSMTVVFLIFSVMVSSATEGWNSGYKKRGRFLWLGVSRMIGATPDARAIVAALRAHPTIRSLSRDDGKKHLASYIPSALFAEALVDVVLWRNAGAQLDKYGLAEAIALLPDDLPLKRSLGLAWARSQGSDARLREEVARQFDDSMDRVSGWYKRDSQVRGFWLGLVMAAVLNVDAVHIAVTLWRSPDLATRVADQGAATAATSKSIVTGSTASGSGPDGRAVFPSQIPIGWPAQWVVEASSQPVGHEVAWHIIAAVIGVMLMAAAGVVGAPVWYQLLTTLLPLRLAGKVPARAAAAPGAAGGTAPAPGSGSIAANPGPAARALCTLNDLERIVVAKGRLGDVQRALGVPSSDALDNFATREAIRTEQAARGYAPTGQLTRLLLQDLGVRDV